MAELTERQLTLLLRHRLARIRTACGELCDLRRAPDEGGGQPLRTRRARVDCGALFREPLIDEEREHFRAPPMPRELASEFEMGGQMPTSYHKLKDEAHLGRKIRTSRWSAKLVDGYVAQARKHELVGNYGRSQTLDLLAALRRPEARLRGASVLVIGSKLPWVEALCLASGADRVTTVEYGTINSSHPRVQALTPQDFRARYLAAGGRGGGRAGFDGGFDAVVSYSSLEHSGLGRYGDALNPWGDLIAVARAWCVARPGARLVVGVPQNSDGRDSLVWNWHRAYGPARYPYLATNWRLVWRARNATRHRVHIFRRLDTLQPAPSVSERRGRV